VIKAIPEVQCMFLLATSASAFRGAALPDEHRLHHQHFVGSTSIWQDDYGREGPYGNVIGGAKDSG